MANEFANGSDHRKPVYGTFDAVDLRSISFNVKSVGIQVNMNKL